MVRCLYEVLEVERDADDSAIRLAYRKAALKWHPDKNQHQAELAGDRFKEIQNAYEVLSDKHERSWYDGHRDAILRSGDRHQAGASSMGGPEQAPDDINLYAYFSSTAYSGFGDGLRSFYGVYSGLFERLAKQEAESRGGKSRTSFVYPSFGTSASAWPEVATFYAEWSSFSSARSFSWADQYNPATAPNRQVRRMIEADNEKARRAARREFNENVREMVAFVKKRDKRVLAHAVEEAARKAEAAALEAERKEREKQERLLKARQYKEAAWLAAEEAGSSGSEADLQEEELHTFYCMACDKHFKSERALQNHSRSKKHKEEVALLRAVMQEDELVLLDEVADGAGPGELNKAEEPSEDGAVRLPSGEEDDETDEQFSSSSEVGSGDRGAPDRPGVADRESASTGSSADDSTSAGETTGEDEGDSAEEDDDDDDDGDDDDGDDDDEAMLQRMLAAQRQLPGRRRRRQRAADRAAAELEELRLDAADTSGEDESVAGSESESEAEGRDAPAGGSGRASADPGEGSGGEASGPGRGSCPPARRRRRAAKEGRKAGPAQGAVPPAATVLISSAASRKKKKGKGDAGAAEVCAEHSCQVCSQGFPSRTQLFKHIAATGHAALKK